MTAMTTSHHSKSVITVCLVALMVTTGCSTSSFMKTSGAILKAPMNMMAGTSNSQSIGKILCLWEAAEGQGLDEKPSRGFAGQVMFFEHGNPTPVKVAGQIAIYQYKDYDPDAEEHTLLHTFKFDSEAWQVHRANGTLGDSYNVFLPYVEKHKERTTCALRVELTLENGQKISSPYTEVTLAGKQTSITPAQRRDFIKNRRIGGKIEPAAAPKRQTAQEALNTMTISMPKK